VFWKHKSKAHSRKPRLSLETITLIKEMAANNRLWGQRAFGASFSSWIFEEVERAIQKYMRPRYGPVIFCRWRISSFAHSLRSSLSSYDRGRRIHVNVTRAPTDSWVARTATRGNSIWTNTHLCDSRERPEIRAAFCASGSNKWHQRASHAVPNARRANAVCERFLLSAR
jgi:putative transposase